MNHIFFSRGKTLFEKMANTNIRVPLCGDTDGKERLMRTPTFKKKLIRIIHLEMLVKGRSANVKCETGNGGVF